MNRSIISYQEYTSSAYWRRPDQLRGLLRNHPDLIANSGPLAAPGNMFTSACLSLHPTENALAVLLSPLSGVSSVAMMPMEDEEPTLNAATRMRWLDVPAGAKVASVEWCDDLLFLGANRSRVIVVDAPLEAAHLSSGVLEPCGALLCDSKELPVGEIIVPHSSHAASTFVRSIRANRDVHKSSLLGVRGNKAFMWDLEGAATPVREWAPHEEEDETAPIMFARWAPKSDSVVLTGSYDGCVMLIDTKSKNPRNGLSFATQRGYAATAAEFNPLLPFVTAVAQMDGSFSLYDVRYTTYPVLTVPSLQGDVSCLQWMKLNADMLVTGGTDGSVALWNIRSPPTYCVGRAQYGHSVADLVTTETYTEQRALGLCIGGEITLTGLHTEAMMLLAPSVSGDASPADDKAAAQADAENGLSPAEMKDKEALACGYLYTRRLREAFALLSECAMNRFTLKDTDTALLLVALIDVNRVPLVDYSALVESKVAEDGVPSNMTLDDIRQAFDLQLSRATDRLCTTVPLDRIRALSKPQPADMQKLEALRLNVLLSRVLETQDTDKISVGVEKALELLSAHPESFELIDAEIVCGIVALLLKKNFEEGEKFVRFLLNQLSKLGGASMSSTLTQRILSTVQEPHITGGDNSKPARRFTERFFRNIPAAQDAVLTQLTIRRLGIEHPKEVIAAMTAYQSRCVQQKLPGMFGWLGFKPLLLFLHCLTAESNYVPFFWTCVQCIDTYGKFTGVRQFESVLFAVVDRINAAASKVADELDRLADIERVSIPILRQIDNALKTAHSFLSVLIRVQLECENAALESKIVDMPVIMENILEVLSNATEDVLDMWGSVVDLLISCGQADSVRKYCLASIRDFSFAMEDLMEVSCKGENDEQLNSILDVCDDFLDAVARRK